MKKELPEFFKEVIKKYPKIAESYEDLAKEISQTNGLDERGQKLVKLGIAIGAKTEGGLHSQVRKCKEAGISDEEIYHAALLAITSIGWPSAMATLSWINDILKALRVRKKSK